MSPKYSPMMMQYLDIKKQNEDCIIFFRLGDFYEMFFDDAKTASKELELALTGRDCGQGERAPMCGVPYHSSEAYIARLVAKGYKVAICEQMDEPSQEKGLVTRNVVRIVTPGTIIDSSMLDDKKNNFICAACWDGESAGLCFVDISTGEVEAVALNGENLDAQIIGEMGKFSPSEVILNTQAAENRMVIQFLKEKLNSAVESGRDELFDYDAAEKLLMAQFHVPDIKKLGFDKDPVLTRAVGALLHYLHETQKNNLGHINTVNFYRHDQYMQLDITARRNLELVETLRSKEKRGSLLWVLDRTKTAMGSRLLRQWMDKPLLNVSLINRRLEAVEELVNQPIRREEIVEELKAVLDIERLTSRIIYGVANARDLKAIAQTVRVLPKIKELMKEFQSEKLKDLYGMLDELGDVRRLIERSITDDPPFSVREGGLIREGYSAEIDELRNIMDNGKNYIAKIEAEEREKTGIKNLKVGYNRVFGYFIEISKSNIPQAPEHYIRKQTLANCERYITEELKQMETTILGAQEKITGLEYEIFKDICSEISDQIHRIQTSAQAVSQIDALTSLAGVAARHGYTRPIVDYSDRIEIKDGRHPVVEQMQPDSLFVPNDTILDCDDNRMAIITGPNMAGKSTYMRQVALIVLMAQIGSFVPAKKAEIGVVDKIFTRIGASDDLSSGQSTFMVEMSEVADIIKNATSKSLLILDEIGRGTSTFDGMSIARAVIEYAADKTRIGAKTLFATHYHELTELEGQLQGVKNYNIAVKKHGFDITFLRKIVRGSADDSYGIEVAKLAGLPEEMISRSKEILTLLEAGEKVESVKSKPVERRVFIPNREEEILLEELRQINAETLSPIEALSKLYELSEKAKQQARLKEQGNQGNNSAGL